MVVRVAAMVVATVVAASAEAIVPTTLAMLAAQKEVGRSIAEQQGRRSRRPEGIDERLSQAVLN